MLSDLRLALRALRRQPLFCFFVATTMALGVGANTAVFGVLDLLLLAELPVHRPGELVQVVPRDAQGEAVGFSAELYESLAATQRVLGELYAATMPASMPFGREARGETAAVQLVSGGYFDVLGLSPSRGRLLDPADEHAARSVAVIAHAFWQDRLGGESDVIGRSLQVDGRPVTVVGVAPRGFFGDVRGRSAELFVPLALREDFAGAFDLGMGEAWTAFLHVVGRAPDATPSSLAPGLQLAHSDLATIFAAEEARGAAKVIRLDAVSAARGLSTLREDLRGPLAALAGIAALLMLSACLNIASLLATRSLARTQEMATRLALGAGTLQILRLLAAEALVLAVLGGLAGSIAGLWARAGLLAWLLPGGADAGRVSYPAGDLRVLSIGLLLSLVAALIFGGLPAWRTARLRIASSLRRGGGQRARLRFGRAAVIAQVSASFLLLFLAGLFLGTLRELETENPGFATRDLLQVTIDTAGFDAERRLELYASISRELEAEPRIRRAGWGWMGLVDGGGATFCCLLGDRALGSTGDEGEEVPFNLVTPGYFEAVGTRLLGGRGFDLRDEHDSGAAVIDHSLARRLFDDGRALDRFVRVSDAGSTELLRIVGVVEDAKQSSLRSGKGGTLYLPAAAVPLRLSHLYLGLEDGARLSLHEVSRALSKAAPGADLVGLRTIETILDEELSEERLLARLASLFGALALALAGVGLYGAIFYDVTRRRAEIALRLALGARRPQVLGLVAREGLGLLGVGVAVGLALALAAGHLVESLLYGTGALSPGAVLGTAAALAAVAGLASLVPALTALSIEPQLVLRAEG